MMQHACSMMKIFIVQTERWCDRMTREEAIEVLKERVNAEREIRIIYQKAGDKYGMVAFCTKCIQGYQMAIEALEQTEQKKGKWIDEIYRDSESNEYHIWVCSECRKLNSDNKPYCPNCGAMMEGE